MSTFSITFLDILARRISCALNRPKRTRQLTSASKREEIAQRKPSAPQLRPASYRRCQSVQEPELEPSRAWLLLIPSLHSPQSPTLPSQPTWRCSSSWSKPLHYESPRNSIPTERNRKPVLQAFQKNSKLPFSILSFELEVELL